MLTMVIPDVEIYVVFACLQYGFNLFARWEVGNNVYSSRMTEFEGSG